MVTQLPQSEGNVLGFNVEDTVTDEEYQQVLRQVRAAIDQYGSVRLLARVPDVVGTEISTIDDRLSFLKNHLDDVERYALVGDSRLVEWMSTLADSTTGIEVRHFNLNDEAEAWTWLRE